MPVNEGQEAGMSAPQVTMPEVLGTGPPPGGLPPIGGPNVPVVPGAGLTGRARFEALEASMPFASGKWGHDYNKWILSLKEDPLDPEFNELIRQAKIKAQRTESGQDAALTPAPGAAKSKMAARERGGITGAAPSWNTADRPGEPEYAGVPEEKLRERQIQRTNVQKDLASRPILRGRPIGSDEIFQPVGIRDPYLDAFLSENGVPIEPGDDNNKAIRSGRYVYMGTEFNEQLGTTRDVYLYVDDAQAAAALPATFDPGVLSQYQTALGLPVTGKMDEYLWGKWDEAVSQAQRYAVAGVKMSVKELFTVLVSADVAARAARGGGGGGVAQMEEFDYYRAMLGVLGDISGVDNA